MLCFPRDPQTSARYLRTESFPTAQPVVEGVGRNRGGHFQPGAGCPLPAPAAPGEGGPGLELSPLLSLLSPDSAAPRSPAKPLFFFYFGLVGWR